MPYPGQIPGFGAPGAAGGDFTAGVDMGWGPTPPGFPGGIWIDVSPPVSQTQLPSPWPSEPSPEPSPPFIGSPIEPDYPFTPPAPAAPPVEGVIEPPPADTYHDYEGYYDPATEPAPEYRSGVIIEGEVIPPSGPDRLPTPKRGLPPLDEIVTSIAGSLIGRVIGRVIGGPIGTVVQEIFTPSELDAEPDVRGWPGEIGAPPGVSSNPKPPAPPPAPVAARPPRPQLPPVPQLPTIGVPTPDLGAIKPWKFDSPTPPSPQPMPVTLPSAPAPQSMPGTTAPQPATSSQPQPQSPAQSASSSSPSPLFRFVPSLPWSLTRAPTAGLAPLTATSPAVSTPPMSSPAPISFPGTTTAPSPAPIQTIPGTLTQTAGNAPPLTPLNTPSVESGASCETGPQRKERQRKQRDSCERFITITIPKHKRRVCAAEAGKILGRKLGRKIGSLVGRQVRGALKKAGVPLAKLPKRKRIPRSIEIGGGFGVEIPKPMRQLIPGAFKP